MSKDDLKGLIKKLSDAQKRNSLPPVPAMAYTLILGMDLPAAQALKAAGVMLPFCMILTAVGLTYIIHRGVAQTFAETPGEPSDAKLQRILMLPRKLDVQLALNGLATGSMFILGPTVYYGRSLWGLPLVGVLGYVLLMLMMFIRQGIDFDNILRPYALREFHQHPELKVRNSGVYWTRQSWYLPYAFSLFILCAIVELGLVISRKYRDGAEELLKALPNSTDVHDLVQMHLSQLGQSVALPLFLMGGFVLAIAAWSAWSIAQQQKRGAEAVQDAIEGLASGKPKLPDWVASDEIGDLAQATAAVFEQLKTLSLSLNRSANQLGLSAEELGASSASQNAVITAQAAALQETQVTAQEIKQTSLVASQKAEGILNQMQRAESISQTGEQAVEQSLASLTEIRAEVMEMANRIRALEEKARQIGNITTTVKDLADQSNMLALNAAIEAVRAGESGRGFGVVAREIRSLADQSIKSTHHVREILHDISAHILSTVTLTEQGSAKVERSLDQIRSFGDNMRQVAGIVRENTTSVRQISAAVSQQNAGINQIFQAVNELSRMMEETVSRLHSTQDATSVLRKVATEVSGFTVGFGWKQPQSALEAERPGKPDAPA